MKTIFLLLFSIMLTTDEYLLFDFNSAETSGQWYLVNDDVMGGVSKSKMIVNTDGTATFSGILSPDNNGGFASVRTFTKDISDSNFKGVMIRLKGDGKTYNVRFRTNRNFDGFAYQAKVETENNVWKEFKIPFQEFKPTFRGNILSGKPELESKNIAQVGLLIADKQFGEFSLEVDWIKFYE